MLFMICFLKYIHTYVVEKNAKKQKWRSFLSIPFTSVIIYNEKQRQINKF